MKTIKIIREYSAGKGEVSDEYIIDVINTFWAKTSSLSQAISQAAAYMQMDAAKVRAIADKWDVTMEESAAKLAPISEEGMWGDEVEEEDDGVMDPGDEYEQEMDQFEQEEMDKVPDMEPDMEEEDDDMIMAGYKNKQWDEEDDEISVPDTMMASDMGDDDDYYESYHVLKDDLYVKGHNEILKKGTKIRVRREA